jgi:two-component sensor histidine kinase
VEQLIPERFRHDHVSQRATFMQSPVRRQMAAGRELIALRKGNIEFPAEITLNHLVLPNRTLVVAAIRDTTARRAAKQRLKDSLAEKELLLREIHHRVKNNLQVVASMLALQAEQLDESRVRIPLELCRQRVLSMSLVHEKLYGAHDFRRVDLGELVREIATMLLGGEPSGRVQVRFSIEPVIVDIETAFPASLLVNELVTNAVKHAFKDRSDGSLDIAVRALAADRGEIVVTDDGPGGLTSESLQSNTSLGSTIIRNLVRQLDAKIRVDPAPGCRIAVSFPLRQAHAS